MANATRESIRHQGFLELPVQSSLTSCQRPGQLPPVPREHPDGQQGWLRALRRRRSSDGEQLPLCRPRWRVDGPVVGCRGAGQSRPVAVGRTMRAARAGSDDGREGAVDTAGPSAVRDTRRGRALCMEGCSVRRPWIRRFRRQSRRGVPGPPRTGAPRAHAGSSTRSVCVAPEGPVCELPRFRHRE
jgi:hypothetical protein